MKITKLQAPLIQIHNSIMNHMISNMLYNHTFISQARVALV